MPTDKPSRRLYYSDEELQALREVFDELTKVGRRGRPEYLGQKVKFNDWLKGLTAEGAERARQALAGDGAAPSSVIVKETMPKTAIKKAAKSRGRPPGAKNAESSPHTAKLYVSLTPLQKKEIELRAIRRRNAEGLPGRWGASDYVRELIEAHLSKPAK